LADLFLDTLPYNGVSTAYHALYAGLPLLTCAGQTFVGRTAGTMLRAVGLPELVTVSPAEYERTALQLARSPEMLGGIRRKLARARLSSALFDPKRFARDSEAAYARMWEIWRAGEPPRPFSVASSPP
jgi:predicted O-linked N-acetylglucosamine transferase (SPINDLY family)